MYIASAHRKEKRLRERVKFDDMCPECRKTLVSKGRIFAATHRCAFCRQPVHSFCAGAMFGMTGVLDDLDWDYIIEVQKRFFEPKSDEVDISHPYICPSCLSMD